MIDLKDVPIEELVDTYNACREMLGGETVSAFKDRDEAERKTRMALSGIADPSKRPGRFAEVPQHNLSHMGRDIRFSEREFDLLDLLPKDGSKITSRELVEKYYGANPPGNARIIIVGRLTGIAEKARKLNMPWTLEKSARAGPNPQSFWIKQAS